jgi:hypothetical protein
MVPKVVTGKILETLELSSAGGAMIRLSKILSYLIGNLYIAMLSVSRSGVKDKAGELRLRFPNWNYGNDSVIRTGATITLSSRPEQIIATR